MPVIVSNIRAWEQSLVDAVTAAFPDLEVQAFPDRPQQWNFIHELGSILVRFHGGKFSRPMDTSEAVVQKRTPGFVFTIYTRNLHDHLGAYDILETLRQAITGFKMPGCMALYPLDEQFQAQHEGVWVYEAVYAAETWSVSNLPVEEVGPAMAGFSLQQAP